MAKRNRDGMETAADSSLRAAMTAAQVMLPTPEKIIRALDTVNRTLRADPIDTSCFENAA